MNELEFETHLCAALESSGWQQCFGIAAHPQHIVGVQLAQYLEGLQGEDSVLQKIEPQALLRRVMDAIEAKWAAGTPTAIILKEGIRLNDITHQVKLLDPNPKKNVFCFTRQYAHDPTNTDRAIDLMLWVNGIPLCPIEIKNGQTGQNARDGMEQLLRRARDGQCPALFSNSIFCASLDTQRVLLSISTNPETEKDFRPYDPSDGYTPPKDEFQTFHFYGDFLSPTNVTELITEFLYEETKGGKTYLIFPRFHQWEAVRLLCNEISESSIDRVLGDNFLLQHSPGSGKSKTIAWLCQFLKTLFVPETKAPIFQKVLVITDRKDLDQQLQRDLKPILGEHAVEKAESRTHLGELLQNEFPSVVTSTVQKFLDFNKGLWPKDKRIAIIIDEAHRSQDGSYNEELRKSLQDVPDSADVTYAGDQICDQISGSNTVIIALTATPTESTLSRFGKCGKPHHVYSMSQAIREGYIINVAKNIITYDTLFQLHQTGASIPLLETYPPSFLNRTLTWAAYESEEIIEEKSAIIAAIIRSRTMHAINGKGRAMLTCISRKAAAAYQRTLSRILKDYDVAPLVAYTDAGDDVETMKKLNAEVGAHAKSDEALKTLFREEDRYRILVVASKFQTGFDETYLHTLFIDKPVRGINAVQTLSRLNRVEEGKEDTLVVDFTNSFAEIAKAFNQFLGQSESIGDDYFTFPDLVGAFDKLCIETETSAEEWTPQEDGKPPSRARMDQTCNELKNKVRDKSLVQRVHDILSFFFGKTLLCERMDWAIRKEVTKGVLGYLNEKAGSYSAQELREAVSAVGLATKLIEIGRQSIDTSAKTKKAGGEGAKPRELTLAEAIVNINLENQRKLFTQIEAVKGKITAFIQKLSQPCQSALTGFSEEIRPTCEKYAEREDIDVLVAEDVPEAWDTCRSILYDENGDEGIKLLKEFLGLIQLREQLAKIESRFYLAQTRLRGDLEKSHIEMCEIANDLGETPK
jgi:HsdR family type I site-specific deoxyribonuclease